MAAPALTVSIASQGRAKRFKTLLTVFVLFSGKMAR